MYLIAGLGNPGKTYEGTRHNVGFAIVQQLAKKHRLTFRKKAKWKAEVAVGKIGDVDVTLLMPLTFMNLSGEAVAAAVQFAQVDISHLLVVVDDAAIAFGDLRLRFQGSSGGHNGLESIEKSLQTQAYARLRVGVGDRQEGDLTDHVLGLFSKEEKKLLPQIVERATRAIEIWLEQGMNRAMEFANSSPSNPSKERNNE